MMSSSEVAVTSSFPVVAISASVQVNGTSTRLVSEGIPVSVQVSAGVPTPLIVIFLILSPAGQLISILTPAIG